MDFHEKTLKYYSMWLGEDHILGKEAPGVYPVYSAERNQVQYGYGDRFDLYVMVKDRRIFASYGDRLKDVVGELTKRLETCQNADDASAALEDMLHAKPSRHVKYVFSGSAPADTQARPLAREEYPLYRDFFMKCNPGLKNIDWLQEYFEEMAEERVCCGYLVNGEVVSCTDAPGMPYMADAVQEIGVNTLKEYRDCGYAAQACAACIREIVKNGKCPVWSTGKENAASRRLAEKVGFAEFAEVLTVTL